MLAAAGAFFPAPEALAQQLPADSAATLRVAAARAVLALEKGRDVEDLMKDDAYRVALDAHEVLRVTGDGPVDALRAKYPDFPRFLRVFLSDRAWMEAYLDAGNVPAGNPYGLETLYRIWKKPRGRRRISVSTTNFPPRSPRASVRVAGPPACVKALTGSLSALIPCGAFGSSATGGRSAG